MDPGEVIAIIPARGGSRGIPRKNLRPLHGVPLIVHTIRHAQEARFVRRVVVSTEDREIAAVAEATGAEVVMRPADLAEDTSPSEAALLHALEVLYPQERHAPRLVVFLQCTSPLRARGDIDKAIETLMREQADSLFSVFRGHPFLWRWEDGKWHSVSYDYRNRLPRQKMPTDFVENGSIYLTRPEILRATGNRLGGKIAVYEMSPLDSLQVDTEEDWLIVEHLFSLRRRDEAATLLSQVGLLVLDFDGVMTDNRVWVSEDGSESVLCHRGDGMAIAMLQEQEVPVVVISRETNPVVEARCRKLGIRVYQGVRKKLQVLREVANLYGVPLQRVAYVGNDVNDLECMEAAGVSIAVADAVAQVRSRAQLVTEARGGHGAVREIIDWMMAGRSTPSLTKEGMR